jgi:hypothetical protein
MSNLPMATVSGLPTLQALPIAAEDNLRKAANIHDRLGAIESALFGPMLSKTLEAVAPRPTPSVSQVVHEVGSELDGIDAIVRRLENGLCLLKGEGPHTLSGERIAQYAVGAPHVH